MRRTPTAPLALLAGLALVLSGCAGETPTSPGGGGGGTGGNCAYTVGLVASTLSPQAGSIVGIRATATRGGQPVADGTSIFFTTDLGFFVENGLQSVSKTTSGGVADVGLLSDGSGTAHVRATLDCAQANVGVSFSAVQQSGPFISSIQPASGSCAGGETVTINGGKFAGTTATVRVLFGGSPATIQSISESAIVVTTPARALANPQVPEDVDVVITGIPGSSQPVQRSKGFRYACVDPNKKIFISSITPNSGSPDGGETVTINGQNFRVNDNTAATTRVQFGGANAAVVNVADTAITVLTPRRILANPNVPETVDVVVDTNLGAVSHDTASMPQGFTYRAGLGTTCNTSSPNLFIATITPNTGDPAGGQVVNITGGGFGTDLGKVRVEFIRGSVSRTGVVTGVSDNSLSVSTPLWVLANPDFAETVDVKVTSDLGGPKQACVTSAGGFTFTRLALEPQIFSTSPKVGPNDASTRVTIFGRGFQFPMQVFLTGGNCGSIRIEAQVVSIREDQIVFQTPIARNGNVCLANQLVDIEIVNPQTNKRATCVQCFKYYDCPTISGFEPTFGDYRGGTTVVISGSNFEENVHIAAANTEWRVVSVSSSQIVAVTNPPVLQGCADLPGVVNLTSLALNCPVTASVQSWTYQVASVRPVITSVSPSSPQAGGVLVTIKGRNFFDNLRVEVGGNPVTFTQLDSQTIQFTSPVYNGPFRQIPCGTNGVQNADTEVPVRVINTTTSCDGTGGLVYIPANTACVTPLSIVGVFATGSFCVPYAGAVTGAGGTPPYSFVAVGLPAGMNMSAAGAVSGTPARTPPPGPGAGSTTFNVAVTITDSASGTATRTIPMAITDTPLSVTGPATISVGGGGTGTGTAAGGTNGAGAPTPTYTFAITGTNTTGCTVVGATGAISGCTTPGTFTLQVTDNSCAPAHVATATVTVGP